MSRDRQIEQCSIEQSRIELKSVNDILDYKFIIPAYQRGYRWDKSQVIDLLNDILEFMSVRDHEGNAFYCLQPIIVKKDKSKWKLIDGQQRLTTIYIILSFLEVLGEKPFFIKFETRKRNESFLKNLSDDGKRMRSEKKNIDFYYISKAYEYVEEWFWKNRKMSREAFCIHLGEYTKVIWYEIDENENEIKTFIRMNRGKIPLTNAELIKALFLNSRNFFLSETNLKQIEIAKEWDDMEFALQNDKFWYFLTKGRECPTRIELLFEIFDVFSDADISDKFAAYRYFSEKAKTENFIHLWSESDESIKKVFFSLEHWFNDRELYHLVGYLVSIGMTIKSIYEQSIGKGKLDFKKCLLKIMRDSINVANIKNLKYGDSSLKEVLLLFNVVSVLNSKESFDFGKFHKEKWSIEHIHAQQKESLLDYAEMKLWLTDALVEIEKKEGAQELTEEIKKFIAEQNEDVDKFDALQKDIFKFFGDDLESHEIGNLALLSCEVNTSISNNVFPVKRNMIIKKDKTGEFIPVCTKNVFLKYYSETNLNLSFWNRQDREEYKEEIRSVLKEFLK